MPKPSECRFAETHEWAYLDADGTVLVGITDFAQKELGDVVYVELPDVGATFEKGEPFGTIESVKAASDLYMPVGGEIVAVNEALNESPELVNQDPYGEGWMIRIRPKDPSELDELMTEAQYQAQVEGA